MKNKEIIYHNFLLRLYEKLKSYYYNATNSNAGEEKKDLTEILK